MPTGGLLYPVVVDLPALKGGLGAVLPAAAFAAVLGWRVGLPKLLGRGAVECTGVTRVASYKSPPLTIVTADWR